MADKLILERTYGGTTFIINPKDYDYDPTRVREAFEDFAELKQSIEGDVHKVLEAALATAKRENQPYRPWHDEAEQILAKLR